MSEAITHRRILNIALPMVLSSISVPILGLVDTGVVGQLGRPEPIGAVGIGALILTTLYWVFGFLRMGMTGLVAQAVGRGDAAEQSRLLMRGVIISAAAGLALIVLQWPLFWIGFWASPASAEVESLARSYMNIRIWGAPAAIGMYALTGWLIAKERTRQVLLLQLVTNGVNIVLDLVFVMGFGWGVEGVALASLIAEWGGIALGLYLCRNVLRDPILRDRAALWDWAVLRHAFAVNRDILIRSLLLQAMFVSFLMYGAKFGDVQLAANQVLLQFLQVTAFGMDGFAFAAEALVGQAMGAKARDQLRRAVMMCSAWCLGLGVALMVVFGLFGGWGIDIMTTAADVRAAARIYLPWMVIAPIVGLPAWMLDGVFIGATRTAAMRDMMAISALCYFAAMLLLVPTFGNHGLWAAMTLGFIVRGISLGLCYPALERAASRGGEA